MTKSFAAMVSMICLFLGSCAFFVTTNDCHGSIRTGVMSVLMSALAWGYLKMVNETPVGFWLMLYRGGIAISGAIALLAVGRIISAVQSTGCQLS